MGTSLAQPHGLLLVNGAAFVPVLRQGSMIDLAGARKDELGDYERLPESEGFIYVVMSRPMARGSARL
jgi:hypothetical protein